MPTANVRAMPSSPPTTAGTTDLRASERLVQLAHDAIERTGVDNVAITGAPAIAAHASASIRRDMQREWAYVTPIPTF